MLAKMSLQFEDLKTKYDVLAKQMNNARMIDIMREDFNQAT